ncbi:heterokaryon incompatibility protein-domain-containing protein [Xylariaceae sp. FL0255]|nr:heterokaryon incompatibility protein-domain-containing protein [Xylariaceae sp. FL0255]
MVTVLPSVERAMRRFRLSDHFRLLWIDSICINQEDNDERASQIIQMGRIFSQANRVMIFLGETSKQSDVAMDAICTAQSNPATLKPVAELFKQHQWFHRLWVVQEVALAQHPLVVCGTKCVPWACFTTWWASNRVEASFVFEPPPTITYNFDSSRQSSMLQQLYETRRSKATNSVDKIYALMGLFTPADRDRIIVDYRVSTGKVYLSAADAIVDSTQSLQLLSATVTGAKKERRDPNDLPTWVPDWTVDFLPVSLGLDNQFQEPYDACGSPACQVEIKDGALRAMGIALDTVGECGLSCPDTAPNLQRVFHSWNILAESHKGNHTSICPSPRHRARHSFSRLSGVQNLTHSALRYKARQPADNREIYSREDFDTIWSVLLALPTPTLDLPDARMAKTSILWASNTQVKHCFGRRLCITSTGLQCLAAPKTKPGDIVVILLGAPVPHILMRKEDGDYSFVGECYVPEVMGGEALSHLSEQLRPLGHRSRPFRHHMSSATLQRFVIK